MKMTEIYKAKCDTHTHSHMHKEKQSGSSEMNSKHFDKAVPDFSHYTNLTASHRFTSSEHKVFTVNLL